MQYYTLKGSILIKFRGQLQSAMLSLVNLQGDNIWQESYSHFEAG